jgi:hypothetical protein
MTQPDLGVTTEPRRGSVLRAAVVMFVLSLLLFWLPVVGPLIAGFVGGRMADGVGKALLAAVIPAIVLAGLLALVLTLFSVPVIGALAGGALFLALVVQELPLLAGAALGGALD